jgi:hypothetical protein
MDNFDEVDLNRLYEALVNQIETYRDGRFRCRSLAWGEELAALVELRDRIGKVLDG